MPRGKAVKSLRLIRAIWEILAEIRPASVRAVCYQLFIRRLIEDMSKRCTNRVSTQLVYAREQDLIPWEWVVDETREAEWTPSWDDPAAFIESVIPQYRRDRWRDQQFRVEVWSEKGTVRGTLAPVLAEYGVTFRALHGYSSATVVQEVARESRADRRRFVALYVGDWDPSGLHMSEVDLPARLARYGGRVALRRVALAHEDIRDPGLPSFSAETKRGDSRLSWYVARWGRRCWELDALNPVVLRERVERAIGGYIDRAAWDRCGKVEAVETASMREKLDAFKAARR